MSTLSCVDELHERTILNLLTESADNLIHESSKHCLLSLLLMHGLGVRLFQILTA